MLILTHSDARVYCLGIAQLIPVLMIALFVVTSERFTKDYEKKMTAGLKVRQEGGPIESSVSDRIRAGEQTIATAEERIASLDLIDKSQAGPEVISALDITQTELIELKERLISRMSELSKATDLVNEADRELDDAALEFKAALTDLENSYTRNIVLSIILALSGEVITLLGAIGLMSGRYAIAFVTDIVIFVSATLCRYAVQNLMPIPRLRFRIVTASWVVFILIAQLILFWTLLLLRVKGA